MSGPERVIVFTGGGSAGHVVPCLPLMARFAAKGWRVHYVGSATGPEAEIVADAGYPFHVIAAGKLRRYWSWRNLADAFRVLAGIWQAFRRLRRLQARAVFSKGGFVGFPVVVGAWLNRIPAIAHESDLTPGLANRLSIPFCRAVCTNFAATRFADRRVEVVHTGAPLRAELLAGDAARGRAWLHVPDGRRVLLAVGGSLGSERLNALVRSVLGAFDDWFVVHVCGAGRTDVGLEAPGRYRQLEYVSQGWGDVLAAADVVVSRAGAGSLYELVALAKPHVLVPLPRAASRGDQLQNAQYAERLGWSRVLQEEQATAETLTASVVAVWRDRAAIAERLRAAGLADGTEAIAAVIERFADEN